MEDDSAPTAQQTESLVCVECEAEDAALAPGWRAYRFEGGLLIYCPGCAAREFDDAD
jgi:hypothetical protein